MGLILMIIIWVLIIVGIVFLVRALVRGPRHPGQWGPGHYGPGGPGAMGPGPGGTWAGGPGARGGNPEALRTLEERYARGEIERDEFLQKKADLLGPHAGPMGQPGDQPPGQGS